MALAYLEKLPQRRAQEQSKAVPSRSPPTAAIARSRKFSGSTAVAESDYLKAKTRAKEQQEGRCNSTDWPGGQHLRRRFATRSPRHSNPTASATTSYDVFEARRHGLTSR